VAARGMEEDKTGWDGGTRGSMAGQDDEDRTRCGMRGAGPVDDAGTAARDVEALRRWSDGVEARWAGRLTEAERRPATETRGDLASIEIDTKFCVLYRVACLVPGRGCARF
jgi:hypothetical protein